MWEEIMPCAGGVQGSKKGRWYHGVNQSVSQPSDKQLMYYLVRGKKDGPMSDHCKQISPGLRINFCMHFCCIHYSHWLLPGYKLIRTLLESDCLGLNTNFNHF